MDDVPHGPARSAEALPAARQGADGGTFGEAPGGARWIDFQAVFLRSPVGMAVVDALGTVVGLYYNLFGPRLYAVGAAGSPSLYEQPQPILDLVARSGSGAGSRSRPRPRTSSTPRSASRSPSRAGST